MFLSTMCAVVVSTVSQMGVVAPVVPDDGYLSWGDESGAVVERGFFAGGPRADINGDGVVDFNDVLAFLNCFQNGLPCADINGDGVLDFSDILIFLNA
jgi:hypothetical protein